MGRTAKAILLSYLSLCVLLSAIIACGGGGSGGGGGNASTPTITANSTPFTGAATHSTTVSLSVSFTWTDGGGDMSGGTLYLIYPTNQIFTTTITATYISSGSTSGTVNFMPLTVFTLNGTVGSVSVQLYLRDTSGNQSSSVYVTLNQT